ncbi:PRC-barrel domain-containing protein [Halobellus clavatus]|jgi:sporulation protein YlmC with PRC-barrel domain|uniref:Sporulation protein YlmC, PRC-barrel domain family n=1 Tax=Halobellus clavatus TaxID=660517 RepID=A0A1H3CPJ0_9EURY|nr:PRC-barrel domain-containing protein [Halobellus clavatus]SDX56025.1 Sporulation protein YlmC, PRC-barrel domain family [Halobellus clavatus]
MDETPEKITTLIGREVYSNEGVFVGEVADVRLDLEERQAVTGLALRQLNDELFADLVNGQKGVILPYRWVRAVGDVILVNDVTLHDVIEQLAQPSGDDKEDSAVA